MQWNELCSALYHSSAVLTSMTWTRPQSESWHHHHHFRCVCHIPRRQMMCSRMSWSKAKCGSCPSQNGPRMVPGWSSANMNNPVPSLKTFVSVNHETIPLSLETVYRQQYRTTALCWVVGEWGNKGMSRTWMPLASSNTYKTSKTSYCTHEGSHSPCTGVRLTVTSTTISCEH